MRTTVVLDDELLGRARHRAVDAGLTLSAWLNEAMRHALERQGAAQGAEPFSMPVFGPSDGCADHSPADFAAAIDDDDARGVSDA